LFFAIISSAIAIFLLARYLPRTSIYRRFALMTSNPPGTSLSGARREFATAVALTPGMRGVSQSILRPSGKARFGDHVVDVITQGEFVPAEMPVTVVETDGMRVVVKATA
jgi:membrane-bound serine protease (ClpP class)